MEKQLRPDRRLIIASALALFLLVFIVHARSRVTTSSDSRWMIPLAHSLIYEGDLDLDEFADRVQAKAYYGIRTVNGRLRSFFPEAPSFFLVPFVYLAEKAPRLAAALLPGLTLRDIRDRHGKSRVIGNHQRIEKVGASFLVAGSAVLMYFVALHRLPPGWALLASLLFAFGTSAWSVASRALWQHTPSILLGSLALLLIERGSARWTSFAALGLVSAAAYTVRPTNAVLAAVCALFALLRGRLLPFAAGGLPVALLFIAYSRTTYGSWLPEYFAPARLGNPDFLEALAANLFSPSRGLFIFSPFLIAGPAYFIQRLGKRSFDLRQTAGALIAAGHIAAVSSFLLWWGGHTYGPRYCSDALPFLIYLCLPYLDHLRAAPRPFGRALFGAAAIVAGVIHWHGATDMKVYGWNSRPIALDDRPARVWDVHDPQFLRRSHGRRLRLPAFFECRCGL